VCGRAVMHDACPSRRYSVMTDRQECRCRVLILGHSFVTWLGDFMDGEEVELGGQMVAWCRIGGAMVATLRAELGRQNVASFCMLVFVEIGSNDCAESLEVLFFFQYLGFDGISPYKWYYTAHSWASTTFSIQRLLGRTINGTI